MTRQCGGRGVRSVDASAFHAEFTPKGHELTLCNAERKVHGRRRPYGSGKEASAPPSGDGRLNHAEPQQFHWTTLGLHRDSRNRVSHRFRSNHRLVRPSGLTSIWRGSQRSGPDPQPSVNPIPTSLKTPRSWRPSRPGSPVRGGAPRQQPSSWLPCGCSAPPRAGRMPSRNRCSPSGSSGPHLRRST
jgi:hypothetical protein